LESRKIPSFGKDFVNLKLPIVQEIGVYFDGETRLNLDFSNFISHFNSTTVASFEGGTIDDDSENILDNCRLLEYLYISKTNFSEGTIPPKIFSKLLNLRHLSINENNLQVLPENLFQMNTKLTRVRFGYSRIKQLPERIFSGLIDFIEELPADIFKDNRKLGRIDFDGNDLKKIPINFKLFPFLKSLDLKGNVCINESFSNATVIQTRAHVINEKCK
jgi:Leucine-rich repeat (LRR) protein